MHWNTPDFYLKSRDEMMELFGELEDALDRTWEIAQRCQVKLEKVKEPFPRFDVPAEHSTDTYFEYVARQGFEKRRPRLEAMRAKGILKHDLADYAERLDREIQMIQKMKFSGYFLIVWDFIRYAKSQGIPVGPGRGSAAGSLVGYAMAITDIDPLQYGLLFERFLNPERVSMPDIDIDFCMNRRGEVIQYVTEKYGREQVAQIITFNTLGARAAIKDVGRVLEMPFADVDRITKLVPNVLNISLDDAMTQEPGFDEAGQEGSHAWTTCCKVALRLEGLARNCSVHAAGVVISPQPLKELVPLYKTNRDEIVTQFDMSGLEKLSLLKMDFLGLTTLTLIQDALRLIEKRHGVELVPEDLPLDDPGTYEIFCKGLTSGVFQFESRGMRDILRRYQPSRLEDLTALNALYRPGPIQGGMVDDFIERKWGRRAVQYDLPELKELLEETYGVIVYQEQVMQISNRIAGYSLGDADLLRRAMGKKKARGDGQAARALHQGRAGTRLPAEEGRKDLRPDGAVRRLRLQQVALGRVCLSGLRHGLPEGALPGGFHGRAAHLGNRQHRQGGEVHQRVPRHGHHHSAARRQCQRVELHARQHGPRPRHPFWPGRGEEPGSIGRGSHYSRAPGGGPLPDAPPVLREGGPGRGQPAHDREPDPRRRHGYAAKAARSQKFAAVEGAMEGRPACLARPRKRPGGPVRRPDCRRAARHRRCPTCPSGAIRRSSPAKKRCWASG